MKLGKHLRAENIIVSMKARSKLEAIDELLDILRRSGSLEDGEAARRDVLAREERMSTGMEMGLAIPHAKTAAVKSLTVAVGLAPEGVPFESLDGQPARAIFLVLSSVGSTGPHIECISEIARRYARQDLRDRLGRAGTPEEAFAVLTA